MGGIPKEMERASDAAQHGEAPTQIDEETRKKLAHAGISQGTDGKFYDAADPSNPMTLEQAKAKAEQKNPGSFPEAGKGGEPAKGSAGAGPVPDGASKPPALPTQGG
jgi:hypothetical protein